MTEQIGRVWVNRKILPSVRVRKAPEGKEVKIEFYED